MFQLSTRGSALARWQAETTAELLGQAYAELSPELLIVRSAGDQDQTSRLAQFGRIGIFTVEVDKAVSDGRAQVAVHSLKDMLTTLTDGLVLAGVLARGPVEDALITSSGKTLEQLPSGARIATGSARRRALLLAQRPDLQIVEIRGNVDTRLAKLEAGDADAIVLARAGLVRLGLADRITEVLDPEVFVPAVGQGIVGWTCRADDAATRTQLRGISDLEAFDAALAERAFLRALRGGCNVPACAHARAVENALALHGKVLALDGTTVIEGRVRGSRDDAEALGRELAQDLIDRGAAPLIEAARV